MCPIHSDEEGLLLILPTTRILLQYAHLSLMDRDDPSSRLKGFAGKPHFQPSPNPLKPAKRLLELMGGK